MTIAVDFDGTIVEHAYPCIGKPVPFAIETLLALQQERHLLVLWTVRQGKELEDAVEYCRKQGLEFYAVNKNYPEEEVQNATCFRKVSADLYIDDRNFGGIPDWGVIYQKIKNGDAHSFTLDSEYKPLKKKNWLVRLAEHF